MVTSNTEKKNIPAKEERSVVDIVTEKVHEFMRSGQLDLPKDYSVENALKSAYLILNTVEDKDHNKVMIDGKLTGICSKASVANAILDMIVQGLNPGKKQIYFIVYGKTLTAQRSYFGSMAVANMVNREIKDWGYNVVYEGDTFSTKTVNGKITEIEHTQKLEDHDNANILAAYAIAIDGKGKIIRSEIMTIDEIHKAWDMSKMKPIDEKGDVKPLSTHGKFPRDMALKTVINKVAKLIINSSSDNALLLDRINRAEDIADAAGVQAEIEEKANTGSVIMIPEESVGKVEDEISAKEQKPEETKPDNDLPSPEEEQTALKKKGMVTGENRKQPGF